MIAALLFLKNNWRAILGVALFAAGWYFSAVHVKADWDEEKRATQEEAMRVMKAHADMIQSLEIQHDQNTTRIDSLAADNRTLRLRLQTPARCGSASTISGVQTTAGDGPLHPDASEVIAGYSEEVGRRFVEADKIVEDCRVMQQYLQSVNVKTK